MLSDKLHPLVQWNPINVDSQTCYSIHIIEVSILSGPSKKENVTHTSFFFYVEIKINEAMTETKAIEMRLG